MDEVMEEVEAVRAVYGEDCHVIREFPPNVAVRLKPRTADDSSQQFVEIVLGIKASALYPRDPPCISILDSKGLDKKREEHLMTRIIAKSQDLFSCSMLVALCEEAVEILSNMNFPEGSCPLCLYQLYSDDKQMLELPFMKLMSCFHCFHSGCIIRWWKWLQEQTALTEDKRGVDQQIGNCPVCRKKFDSKDFEHVVSLVEANYTPLSHGEFDSDDEKELLQSDMEECRRQKFEVLKEMQKKNNGFIEPKEVIAVLPGMFLLESQLRSPAAVEMLVDSNREHISNVETQADSRISSGTTIGVGRHSNYTRNRVNNPRRGGISQGSKRWIPKKEGSSYK